MKPGDPPAILHEMGSLPQRAGGGCLGFVASAIGASCSLFTPLSGYTGGATVDAGVDAIGQPATDAGSADAEVCEPPPNDPPPRGQTYYLTTTGDDANPGTPADPWKRFDVAVTKLHRGDTLIVMDGVYPVAQNGRLNIDCNVVENGSAADPIVVRAQNERKAWLQGDGASPTLRVNACSHWRIEGLYLSGADVASPNPNEGNEIVGIFYSNSIRFRRSLVARTNRCITSGASEVSDAVHIYGSSSILLEENEVYDYHGTGIAVYGGTILRGNYTAARDYASRNPPGCSVVAYSQGQADVGTDALIENAVSETNISGFRAAEGTQILGSIALDNDRGVYGESFWIPLVKGATLRDVVVAYSRDGITSIGWGFTLSNVSLYANSTRAIFFTGSGATGAPNRGLAVSNSLVFEGGPMELMTIDTWRFDGVDSVDNTQNFPTTERIDDGEGSIQRSLSVRPEMGLGPGQCLAYVPDASPLRSAAGGRVIGANLTGRYRDGVLTCEKYWEPGTGRFRCGATVAGVNDDPEGRTIETRACINVHRRLNFVAGGCPVPP
jgi:hypothetical protein